MPVVFASGVGLAEQEDSDLSQPPAAPAAAPPPPMEGYLQTPQVWLDHQVFVDGDRLVFNWDAVEDLFPPGLVQEMFDAYCGLLADLSAEEDAAWHEEGRQLVPAAQLEQRALVNATAAPVSALLLQDLFAARAAARPDAPAVLDSARTLTYGELDRRAAHLGRRLRDLGARPNELVAVVMEKGWEQVVAVLGILRSGAAYLPVDPDLPAERFALLLEQGEVSLAVTQPWLADRCAWPAAVRRLVIEEAEPEGPVPPAGPAAQSAEDLAYVIFTSGSTGVPKGVMIEHQGVLNTVVDVNRRFAVGPEDRVLALSALSFDLSVYDLFGTVEAGGTIVIPGAGLTREPALLAEWAVRTGVTVWNSVPALMEMLVDHLEARAEPLPPSLRLVLLSGDWIPVHLPGRIAALSPGVRVVSLGGATEASIWSILHLIGTVDPARPSIPYGRPMRNQRFHVLDERLEPCPEHTPGQLYIGGLGLARGYWGDEEKTAASFLRHPRTGERLYRTGDLGRWLPDGEIEFLGREDFQVKIQGYRIELGEIETVLARQPGVRSAVVLALGEKHGHKRLATFVVPAQAEEPPAAEELRHGLQETLPAYMIPASILLLPELPLNANGKVDRGALALLGTPGATDRRAVRPPGNEVEITLLRIWEEVLATSPLGVDEDFFDLGGDSVLAVRLMGQIQRELGRDLPLATLFERGTIERLADLLAEDAAPSAGGALVRIRPTGTEPPFFCVHPVGGSVLCYVDLARRLGAERPFYGLQVPTTPRRASAPLDRIEALASRYVAAVREVQPAGPYRLGGWSMGGVVAFAMALQLRDAGEEVALLVLVDAGAPSGAPDGELDDSTLRAAFAEDLARLAGGQPPEIGAGELGRLYEVYRTNLSAMLRYEPDSYAGDIVLLHAAGENAGAEPADPTLGWSRVVAGRLTSEPIPGDHYTIMREPGVDVMAERLRAHLDASIQEESR